jgi:hypothetical protein
VTKILPLLTATHDILRGGGEDKSRPIFDLLPEECEQFATDEGLNLLRQAMPRRWRRLPDGRKQGDPCRWMPAPWEKNRRGWTPRQSFGDLIEALRYDIETGGKAEAATVWVRPRRKGAGPARLEIVRYDERTIRRLRERPLLLLDATLHPALGAVLDVERQRINFQDERKLVQVLAPLLDSGALTEVKDGQRSLSVRGRLVGAQLAALAAGRRTYVLCKKTLQPLLEREAAQYYELRRTTFVTPRRERGWNADEEARLFVVLGRYAKPPLVCTQEAHALRAVHRRLIGTTAGLDEVEHDGRPPLFKGRGKAIRYRGELVERVTRLPEDRLAVALQDADRIASVIQFVGRDRSRRSFVFLVRGDPTIPVDVLIEEKDLATALPAGKRRRTAGAEVPGEDATFRGVSGGAGGSQPLALPVARQGAENLTEAMWGAVTAPVRLHEEPESA